MFTIQYKKNDRGRAVAMTMFPPLPTKPIPFPDCVVLAGRKKKNAQPRTKWRGVSYGKIEHTTMAVTQDLLSGMPLVL